MAEAVRTKGWLIFNSHDVDEQPGRYGTSPDLLAFAAATANESGCSVVTIAEGLTLVAGADRRDPEHDTAERNDGSR